VCAPVFPVAPVIRNKSLSAVMLVAFHSQMPVLTSSPTRGNRSVFRDRL
jgi:hypothetical protein